MASEQCKLELFNFIQSNQESIGSESSSTVASPVEKGAPVEIGNEDETEASGAQVEQVEQRQEATTEETEDDEFKSVAAKFQHAQKVKDEHFMRVQTAVETRVQRKIVEDNTNVSSKAFL